MTVQECYAQAGGNYNDVMARLMTEERVKKYLAKILNDSAMECLTAAVQEKDYEQVFLHSHNLKGVCLNLGLTMLGESSGRLCEAVRGGVAKEDIAPLFEQTQKDYEQTTGAIRQLLGA